MWSWASLLLLLASVSPSMQRCWWWFGPLPSPALKGSVSVCKVCVKGDWLPSHMWGSSQQSWIKVVTPAWLVGTGQAESFLKPGLVLKRHRSSPSGLWIFWIQPNHSIKCYFRFRLMWEHPSLSRIVVYEIIFLPVKSESESHLGEKAAKPCQALP